MTQSEKTNKILDSLDFTSHDPQNLLECFYVASSEAEMLALKIDRIANLARDWPERHWIAEILGEDT